MSTYWFYRLFNNDSFVTTDEIVNKYQIGTFGNTDEKLILKMFNNKIDEKELEKLMDNNLRPYDILNLARYFKYIKNDNEKYEKYVMKSKELGCIDSYNVITYNMSNENNCEKAINFINNEINNGLDINRCNIGLYYGLIQCGKKIGDYKTEEKYEKMFTDYMMKNPYELSYLIGSGILKDIRYKLRLQRFWQYT